MSAVENQLAFLSARKALLDGSYEDAEDTFGLNSD